MASRDPFRPLTRNRRMSAWRDRLSLGIARPWRRTRLDPRREGPPNLMMIAVDTLRADHAPPQDGNPAATPAMNALAREGTVFRSVTAPAPWTLPSFTSALTGLMPSLHGAGMKGPMRNMAHEIPGRLPERIPTLARHLGRLGYRTVAFHSNPFVEFGLAESFDEHHYRNHACADVARLATDWIRRHGDRPFFCFILFNDPHEPTLPPPRLYEPLLRAADATGWAQSDLRALARWGGTDAAPHLGRVPLPLDESAQITLAAKKALYAAAVTSVDESVGALVNQLGAWGLDESTVVALISDHGEEFLEHAREADLWNHDPRDLRAIGHGQSLFGELLDVPWILRGPGIPAGRIIDTHVSLCDVAPTVSRVLGVDPFPLPAHPMPELIGQALDIGAPVDDSPRTLLAENIAYGPDLVAVRRGRWKLIAHRAGESLALYDLEDDPGETRDRRHDQPEKTAELEAVVGRWRESATDDGGDGDGWESADEKILRQLRELGYAD